MTLWYVCASLRETVLSLSVQVLRWYGYFKEAVTESAVENFRVRKVVIFFYLEDNSCQVVEPKEDNSGLPQVLLCLAPFLALSCPVPCPASSSAPGPACSCLKSCPSPGPALVVHPTPSCLTRAYSPMELCESPLDNKLGIAT